MGFNFGGPDDNWEDIADIWADNKTINGNPVVRMAMPNGQVMYAIDLGAQMESRDYVDASEQVWMGDWSGFGTFALDDRNDTLVSGLQAGAYSYANPVLTDDGEVMFYLSDRKDNYPDSAKDIRNTRVAVSTKSGGQFQEGKRLGYDTWMDGYGDSGLKVAGNRSSHAAVWVRQVSDYTWEGVLDEEMQLAQMNGTEIYAAVPSVGEDTINGYAVTRLTENLVPDLAPVVATNGTHTVVAWREVSSSDTSDLTNFNEHDAILFRVYDGANWGETHTLYNGTSSGAAVKGLEMAMLADGTAAVVYTLDTNAANDDNTDWETVLALIPNESAGHADGNSSEDAVLTFRLTTDNDLDENPQITTASFNGTERFVVAWHTKRTLTDSGETESDIRLAALNSKGELYENMPESVRAATGGTGDSVDANFRLAKNAKNIDDLAILWVDTVSAPADSTTYESLAAGVAGGYSYTGHDVLKAVRFVEDSGSYTLSGTVEVAEMEDSSFIDHFDAYMDGQEVKSVILGTDYSNTTQREVTISDGTTDQTATINVANPVSGMYTATANFTNQVEESAVMLEYDKLYPNSDIDVQFTIRNSGKDPVTKLEITAGNDTVYTSGNVSLNLLPNRDITVTAKIPTGAAIEDVDYTIKATFGDGVKTLDDTLHLDIPDVGVSKVETIKEADGERTLRYSLYNALSASLADTSDDWQVQVGFYADQGCTKLLNGTTVQTINCQRRCDFVIFRRTGNVRKWRVKVCSL